MPLAKGAPPNSARSVLCAVQQGYCRCKSAEPPAEWLEPGLLVPGRPAPGVAARALPKLQPAAPVFAHPAPAPLVSAPLAAKPLVGFLAGFPPARRAVPGRPAGKPAAVRPPAGAFAVVDQRNSCCAPFIPALCWFRAARFARPVQLALPARPLPPPARQRPHHAGRQQQLKFCRPPLPALSAHLWPGGLRF